MMDDIWVQTIERLLFSSALIIGKLSVTRLPTAITAIPSTSLGVELLIAPTIPNPLSILAGAILVDCTVFRIYAVEAEWPVRIALLGLATKLSLSITRLSTTVTKIVPAFGRVVWSVGIASAIAQKGRFGDAASCKTLHWRKPFYTAYWL